MTNRERALAVLNYGKYDRLPCVAFGYWGETVQKWADQGHITREMADNYCKYGDNGSGDKQIMSQLGFDFNWSNTYGGNTVLMPPFEEKLLEEKPNGQKLIRNSEGLLVMIKPGTTSIPSEVGTSLTDREAWEELYLPRLQYSADRVDEKAVREQVTNWNPDLPKALRLGSYIGIMRNLLGVEHFSYLLADDYDLYVEIADTLCNLCYKVTEKVLSFNLPVDYAHFWEDICFKNGPLVIPSVFEEIIGPHYKKVTDLLHKYGVNIVSVDCDGKIDALLPIWLENGVNTMFPIEVGTWEASIAPWREKYGKELRGVGGMDKRVFAQDKAAIDREIERLKALVALGGYIPCPDHRIAPDAKYELVAYYCEQFQKTFR
ncbi:MAG TPA: hypothetical protein PK629_10610 [Oscillospiraceae bacterium]|nr:hypothetical protein [Oscillospiraceae bacterium]HPF55937.1 hypothetical protein [Clostridiales bacterium]HPK36154.1 hypothetical protein [Oscillospiraceae bacterium]HPR76532.1 hypothetical protein [Oscillospiraceae bacterium]